MPSSLLFAEDPATMTELERSSVHEQLARMLRTPLFSQSRRYAPLLRFVVEESLAGRGGQLKERMLGMEVFGRDPGYDTAADPIVRVTIAEIRKRIAQYYHDAAHRQELRIELPSGHYAAEFHFERPEPTLSPSPAVPSIEMPALPPADPTETLQEASPATRRLWFPRPEWLGGFALLLMVGALSLAMLHHARVAAAKTPAKVDLWSALLAPGKQVLLCLPTDVGKHRGALTQAAYLAATPAGAEQPAAHAPHGTFLQHETQGENVVFSDAVAAIRVANALAVRAADVHVRLNNAVTLDDLRQGPAVLIGGLDNQWSLQSLAHMRYRFAGDDDLGYWISDANDPANHRWALNLHEEYTRVTRDYALLAFVYSEQVGQPQLILAGIGMSGTVAASEFVSDPAKMAQLQQRLGPAGLAQDFEVVLSTDVVRGIAGPPHMEAVFLRSARSE